MWDNLKRALKDTTAAFLPPGYLESLDMINDVSVDGLSRGVERFGDVSSQFHIDIEDHYDRHKQQHIGSHMQMDVGPAGGGKNPWSERLGMRNWDVVGDVALALEKKDPLEGLFSRSDRDLGLLPHAYSHLIKQRIPEKAWSTEDIYGPSAYKYESLFRPDGQTNRLGTPLVESLRTDVRTNSLGTPLADPNSIRADRWMETPPSMYSGMEQSGDWLDYGQTGAADIVQAMNAPSPDVMAVLPLSMQGPSKPNW